MGGYEKASRGKELNLISKFGGRLLKPYREGAYVFGALQCGNR
jgi:hypothetical protein